MIVRPSMPPKPMPDFPAPPKRAETDLGFTSKTKLAWTSGVAFRSKKVVIGGSPAGVTLLPRNVRDFAQKLFHAGRTGITAQTEAEQEAAAYLLDLGIADPLPIADREVTDVDVVIPVYKDTDALERALLSLKPSGLPIIVVDDASPKKEAAEIKRVTAKHGAKLIVNRLNGGPGAARTAGFNASKAPFVAFIDSDVQASPDWIARLRPLFDDPLVGAVGPRVLPNVQGTSTVELYEETRSELDMGDVPSHVIYGASAGWLPSASVFVRRSAVTDPPFEPGLRVGEDVDLFWRMDEAGWKVLYVPDVINRHDVRTSIKEFSGRRAMYGGSAADLEARHPRRLIPAQPSLSGLLALFFLARGWFVPAAIVGGYEVTRHRRLLDREIPLTVVAEAAGRSIWADWFWLGHLLRRDWWPIGALIFLSVPFSKTARGVAAAMLWEPVRDHLIRPTRLDPLRSLLLRALDDASYGTGVITNGIKAKQPNVFTPRVRFPFWPRR